MQLTVSVPKEVAGYVNPAAPYSAKMEFLQTSGSITPVNARIAGIAYLMFDEDQKIATQAYERFRRLPENVLTEAVDQGLDQPVADFVVREHHGFAKLLAKIILRDQLSEDTFHHLVLHGSDQAIDTVRRRNMNFFNSPDVIEYLFRNAKVRKGTVDRILAVLGLDIRVTADDEVAPPKMPESPQPPRTAPQPQPKTAQAGEEPRDPEPYAPAEPRKGPAVLEEEEEEQGFDLTAFRSFFEDTEFNFAQELMSESDRKLTDEEKEGLYLQIIKMSVSHKIVLAIRGNREARNLLLRDGNRLIPLYVLQNKGITEDEVAGIAMNKSASRDLIIEISKSREWTRSYKVRRELAMNPKTPLDKALMYLNVLSARDIREISRSKNVPTSLAIAAQRLVKKKRDTGTIH